MKTFKAGKSTLMGRMKKTELKPDEPETALGPVDHPKGAQLLCVRPLSFQLSGDIWTPSFICTKTAKNSRNCSKTAKGSAFPISRDLVEVGEKKLNDKQKEEFYPILFDLMEKNMKRLQEEVTWFCDKQDYMNKDKDWGNSRDSVQRAMQKLGGGYPADPVFKIDY